MSQHNTAHNGSAGIFGVSGLLEWSCWYGWLHCFGLEQAWFELHVQRWVYSNCLEEGGSSALGCWPACALCQTYEDVVPSLCHLESSLHLEGPVFVLPFQNLTSHHSSFSVHLHTTILKPPWADWITIICNYYYQFIYLPYKYSFLREYHGIK